MKETQSPSIVRLHIPIHGLLVEDDDSLDEESLRLCLMIFQTFFLG